VLPAGPAGAEGGTLAVLAVQSGSRLDRDAAALVTDAVRQQLGAAGGFEVLPKSRMAPLERGRSTKLLNCAAKECAVEAGRLLGAGTVVMALAAVNPDATIGEGSILNTGCVVEHDCRLGRFVHLSPNAALGGGVQIGHRSHLGLGAVALPGVRIGSDVRVGAGAVAHRDVGDGATVVGVPARPIHPGSRGRGGPA
jgi:sugar O-acyltransferase (sialic acid O-acetyltransferase NeuD family)